MTLEELRDVFSCDTEILIKSFEENSPKLKVNNYLMGSDSFRSIKKLGKVKAIRENALEVTVDMPIAILEAWKKHSDEYYNEYYNG